MTEETSKTRTKAVECYMKSLGDLVLESCGDGSDLIEHVSYHSGEARENTLFMCKGANFSQKYLEEAKERGATWYVSEKKYDVDMNYILVRDIRLGMGTVIREYFGDLSNQLKLLGITGTKGKSTTTLFVRSILDVMERERGEKPTGVLCSILTYDGKEELPSRLTTKEPLELYHHLDNAVESGLSHVTMEVSSQAVKYHRIFGLDFEMGCYLNIGEDHISPSEHPDFEDYFASKLAFFARCKKLCVNLDGVCTDRVLEAVPDHVTLRTCSRVDETADYYVTSCEKHGISSEFTVKCKDFTEKFSIPMAGLFNIDNALCAIALCYEMGATVEQIRKGLPLGRTPGRMELYESQDKKVAMLVDYAHNKMSFQALFTSMKEEFPSKKLVAVFGCPGEKALDRREDMGKIADQFADFSLLTEDDPSKEDITSICEEIASYMGKKQYKIQIDRPKAVEEAVALYPEDDVLILLLGKGTETDQKRYHGYETMPTDAETALDVLARYDGGLLG